MDLICEAFNIDQSYFLIDHDKSQNALIDGVPAELYNELLRVKDLSPEARESVIKFIRFQISEMEAEEKLTNKSKSRRKTSK